jgi:dihydropteroate synthase
MSLIPRKQYSVPAAHGRVLKLGERCLVMGILNVTPDSFAEISPTLDPARAADAALKMEDDGADLVDIGGESTRPGAEPVSARDEMARVLPVIERLAGRLRIPMTVDTYKADVAAASIDAGAAIVNDVSGLRHDPRLATVTAERRAALVLMHLRGRSKTMYAEAVYDDLIGEITAELRQSVERAVQAGVPRAAIVVDPGLGFAKRPAHSYGVLARFPEIAAALDRPLLLGPSRKSFLKESSGDRGAPDRDWATAAAVTAAVLHGAHMVRVHAVPEMVQVVRTAEELRRALSNESPADIEHGLD